MSKIQLIPLKELAFVALGILQAKGHPPLETKPFDWHSMPEDRYFLSDPSSHMGVLVEWWYDAVSDYMKLSIAVKPKHSEPMGVDMIFTPMDRALPEHEQLIRFIVPAAESIWAHLNYQASKSLLEV